MYRSKARPLEPLDFRARPLAPHAIAWSCDAELAVATEDTIHIYLPEYPRTHEAGDEAADDDLLQAQFTLTLTASGIIRPDPAINSQLCAFAGVSLPATNGEDSLVFKGAGNGTVTKAGAALGQTLRVEWSPNGLGQNMRPILTALTTTGSIVALGEHIDRGSAMASSSRSRTFKNWKILWGLGAQLPIPDGESRNGFRNMNERVVSFSWAREIAPGTALLAYMNDWQNVVIMGVQFFYKTTEGEGDTTESAGWEIFEIGSFNGRGPHNVADSADPDFIPTGGLLSLRWSPWYITKEYRTAMLSYVTHNHVGFRRVTIQGEWLRGQDPNIRVEDVNSMSICTFLSADAFVEWENVIWQDGDAQLARGAIATPFVVKPFQIDLRGTPMESLTAHSTTECSTMYTKSEQTSTNPITGLIIHQPDPAHRPLEPLYSLVRLSATPTNQDWYQTNVPSTDNNGLPQWAKRIQRALAREVLRVEALGGIDSESDSDSEFDEPEVDMTMLTAEDDIIMSKVHPHRYRIWGMAASPGGGCAAVLVSKHSTQHSDRRPRARVLFSWLDTSHGESIPPAPPHTSLTTEGTVWEAMYGNILEMPSFLSKNVDRSLVQETLLRMLFKGVLPKQECVFCGSGLLTLGEESTCEKGHSFATCTATGLAIMAPGISRVCSVCELRCLNVSELSRIAKEHLGQDTVVESSGEVCGGCGGKFLL